MQCLRPTQTAAQQAIARLIHAYPLWTAGIVEAEKWVPLVHKFSELYEVDISPSARQWRKRCGQCCAHLIGAELPPDAAGQVWVRWVLLVTEQGEGLVKARERLQDARKTRLVWGDYVLMPYVRPGRTGRPVREERGRWSWYLTPEVEQREAAYLGRLAQACASSGDPRRLQAYVRTLLHRPMHAGVRAQVAKMLRRAQKLWARHARGGEPWPGPDPAKLPVMCFRASHAERRQKDR